MSLLRWPHVALEMGAGAQCARTGTKRRVERRGGPVCGAPLPRLRSRSSMLLRRGRPGTGRRGFLPEQVSTGSGEADDRSAQGPVEQSFELPVPQMAGQLVDVTKIVVELAMSSGEAGSSGPGADDTTRLDDATFAKAVGKVRPLRIAEHSVPTASALAVSSGEAGSARPGEKADAGVKAVARPAGGARPLVIAKHSTKTESDVAVSSGEAGPSWPRATSTPSVFDTAGRNACS